MDSSNYSLSDLSAMMQNGNNNGMNWNSPMWLIWALLFGNGAFGGFNRNNAAEAASTATIDMNAKLNQLSQQIQDNQATNTLNAGINANHDYLHDFQNAVNLGFAGTNAAINNSIQSNIIGQKDAASQMASCCCDIKSNILQQTNQLGSRIDQLANGMAQGFAQVGFLTQQQTNELNVNANNNTQRIIDQLNNAATQELRDKLYEASQTAQTATIINSLKTTTATT